MGGPSMHWTRLHYTGQKIKKGGTRGGDAKSILFAPVNQSEIYAFNITDGWI